MSRSLPRIAGRHFSLPVLLILTITLHAQLITTVAGGSIGDGHLAVSAGLPQNQGIVADSADNLYILDLSNNRVRKVDAATGLLSTFAGNGTTGYTGDGGLAINAGLRIAQCLGIDWSANVYVAEAGRIRKIDAATGIITTIAGTGFSGFTGDGGPAIKARIASVMSIAADTAGNIYFADGQRVRKITKATGIINTIAGTGVSGYSGDGGPAVNAQLAFPRRLAVDVAGNVYIADNNNNVIRKITAATGIITTYAGSGAAGSGGDGGPATSAQLGYSNALTTDLAGNLYLSDNNKVRKVDAATGIISTVIGTGAAGYSGDGGNAALATFYNVWYIFLSLSGNMFIDDRNNYVIRKVTGTTNVINTIAGNHSLGAGGIGGPVADAQIYKPMNVAVDSTGNIYLADYYNYKIYRIDAATDSIYTVAGTGNQGLSLQSGVPATSMSFTEPRALIVDAPGNFYFAANGTSIRKVDAATGIISTIAGTGIFGYAGDGGAATDAKLNNPYGLAFDVSGNLYIADKDNNAIRKISAGTGIITTVAGTGTAGYSGDGGLATSATLNKPFGVAVDRAGNIYISDNSNFVIRKVDASTGIITTVAGTGTAGYSGDGGLATAAMLQYPYGLATDTAGNLFIADQFNQRIRKITVATGIISTVAGTGLTPYNGDNIPATTANLNNPTGVCFDASGNLYIAGNVNNRIQKVIYDTIPADTTGSRVFVNRAITLPGNSTSVTSKIFPNPAHENVVIALQGNINGNTSVLVTDLMGKVLMSKNTGYQNLHTFTTTLPVNQFAKGIYFVTVYVNKTKYVQKLMVQ